MPDDDQLEEADEERYAFPNNDVISSDDPNMAPWCGFCGTSHVGDCDEEGGEE